LRFEDRPDYDYLKRLFRELFFRKGYSFDNVFDWDMCTADGGPPPPDDDAVARANAFSTRKTEQVDSSMPAATDGGGDHEGDTFMAYRSGMGGVGAAGSGGPPGVGTGVNGKTY
jgi:hypothetical protein